MCKIKTFFDVIIVCVFEFISIFMDKRLVWANKAGLNLPTLSGIQCVDKTF